MTSGRRRKKPQKLFLSAKVTRGERREERGGKGVKVPPPQVDPLPRNLAFGPSDSLSLSLSFISSRRRVFPVRPRASGVVAAFPAYASVSRPAPALGRSESAIPMGVRTNQMVRRSEPSYAERTHFEHRVQQNTSNDKKKPVVIRVHSRDRRN